ncbi:IS4 family transposase [Roseiconus lacunae]|uniref:IS4 family transposase n=1 Tax=Roseiconus lacunae TaxID=2605694 RepID=UPI0030896310|nr:IS4 family transposase [Stieleria sp. HD01]WRQ52585.1 IS4 family transposase [Stieleria sp. HD01]WRQ53227.1 IS4 family transposase [Stieleria sp. HD01]
MKVVELAEELSGGEFGDARLNRRARVMAEALAQYPNMSIPAALKSKADIEGAYRFFNNDSVKPDCIIASHIEATYQRIDSLDFILCVQDTTEIDLTRPKQQVDGAGPMDCESRRGAFFHPMIAFDAAGVPLGFVGQKSWTREEISRASKAEKAERRRKTPIEEKESYRWIEGLRWAEKAAAACPETTTVCVGDSESDIYDLFAAATASEQPNLHLLVRAGQNRNTTEGQDWVDQVRLAAKIGDQTVAVRARIAKTGTAKSARSRSREARTAELEIRKATIELRRPVHGDRKLPSSITVNVVLCEETSPPEDADPISWMLVTTLAIDTIQQVQRIISSYCVRWQIEVYFRTLKSGCKIERRRFEAIDRVLNALAFFSVIAWRVMYVCHLGRECPEMDCEVMFEPSEWKSVYSVLGEEIPHDGCPSLNEVVRAVARLGGFMNRATDEPGTQTLWIGLQRSYDLSNAWNTFGPGAKNFSHD